MLKLQEKSLPREDISSMFSRRLNLVFLLFCLFGALISWRLFTLQVLQSKHFEALSDSQKLQESTSVAERKEIFMQDKQGLLYPLAVNREIKIIYANPRQVPVAKAKHISSKLADILEISAQQVFDKLSKHSEYQIIKRNVSPAVAQKVANQEFPGVKVGKEIIRYYPQGELASHVVGFLGYKGHQRKGQYGVEAYYDKFLRREDSSDLVLTLDYNIQFKAKQELAEAIDKYAAEGGSVTVMDPTNGRILALATAPDFNPNRYSEVEDYNLFLNPVVSKVYEPGSAFKPIVVAGGLEEGVIKPTTTYYDKGYVQVRDRTIHNAGNKSYGRSNIIDILSYSINTGAVFVQQKLGQDKFREYVRRFGFDKKTGIDLPYEAKGNIFNLYSRRPINFATAAFGQGIAVTPIAMLQAMQIIANKGVAVPVHLVDEQRTTLPPKYTSGRKKRRVISQETASRLTSMLVEVVEQGHGRQTKLDSYYVAGKTGTAQVPEKDAPGYSDKTIHTFVGFAPAYSPQFVMLVKLDNPKKLRFSAGTAVPVFKEIAQYILNYYEIPPTKP